MFIVDDFSLLHPEKGAAMLAKVLMSNPALRAVFVNKLAEVENHAADLEDGGAEEASWDDLISYTCFALMAEHGG